MLYLEDTSIYIIPSFLEVCIASSKGTSLIISHLLPTNTLDKDLEYKSSIFLFNKLILSNVSLLPISKTKIIPDAPLHNAEIVSWNLI